MKNRLLALTLAVIMLLSMVIGGFAEQTAEMESGAGEFVAEITEASESVSPEVPEKTSEPEAEIKQSLQEETVTKETLTVDDATIQANAVDNSETSQDSEAARNVMDLISEIGEITLENASAIENAVEAYEALNDVQKSLVENYNVLKNAQEKLATLTASEETITIAPEETAYLPTTSTPQPEELEMSMDDESEIPSAENTEITWSLNENGLLLISGIGTMGNYSEENPAPWAKDALSVYTVIIENGIMTVGDSAFCGEYVNLREVVLPNTLEYIGERAFEGCAALEVITFPQTLCRIDKDAFKGCANLKQLNAAENAVYFENIEIADGNEVLMYLWNNSATQIKVQLMAESDLLEINGETEMPAVPQLSALSFRRSTNPQSEEYSMQPKFNPEVHSYTIIVPDTVNPVNEIAVWATLPDAAEGEITVEYVSLINNKSMRKTVTSGAETGTTLMGCVKVKDLRENDLTIKINDEEAYTVKLVKQPTLSDLQINADGENVDLDREVAPEIHEYNAKISSEAELTVNVQTTVQNVSVKLNGENTNTLKPVWMDRKFDLSIRLSADGAADGEYVLHMRQLPAQIKIKTSPVKTSYAVGDYFDITGLELQAVYENGEEESIDISEVSFEPVEPLTKDVNRITLKYGGLQIELPIQVGGGLKGSGTQKDPWLIESAADFETVRELVEKGMSFKGEFLKMTDKIMLPEGWTPIGSSMEKVFSGSLDGGDYRLIIPKDGLPLLGCVQEAKVSNLEIYGERIAGYGLVNGLEGVGYSGVAITIDHVTLKSGSSTLKSGLIGTVPTVNPYAGCSKDFVVNISNCTVESNVVIGYDKKQQMIGSIAGRVNGRISNCKSAATVYGTDYVGGILGSRDNALGNCKVTNCQFTGNVSASGEQAGGIVGGGYSDSTAPNGIRITIENCNVSGNVSGKDKVGGILGGDIMVAQAWDAYRFADNSFTGKVSGSGNAVGGVIGYYRSLNRLDDITGNYYSSGCGAKSGFGFVMYVDTNCESHEKISGAIYFNTETSVDACPIVTGCAWKKAHNRSDDPLGANAAKLMRTDDTEFIEVTGITLSQTELDLKAGDSATLTALVTPDNATDNTVRWKSGNEKIAVVTNGVITAKGFGETVITATAGKFSAECRINVTAEPAENAIVYMTVSNRGVLAQAQDGSAMFNRDVTVKDINSDGILTYDEALVAAHAAYCPGGYISEDSGWGVSVSKLWDVETMNVGFYLNDELLTEDVGNSETSVLYAGDYLAVSVNKDDTYYADYYVSFGKRSSTATVGKNFSLRLNGCKDVQTISIGYWNDGQFMSIEGASVDSNGNVSLIFNKTGNYLLTAEGSVRNTVQNWNAGGAEIEADCPVIAPGCWVKVEAASVNPTAKAERLTISGNYKKTYAVGDKMDLNGMVLTVHYSDGKTREISTDDADINGFDTATRGEKTVTVSFDGLSANFSVTVTKAAGTIDITLSVLGDSKHGSGKTHTLAKGGLSTWIKATTWNIKSGSTVWDVLKKCLDEYGMKYSNPSGNYVASVNGLAEFDNGKNSGWMYTLNGKYPLLGVSEQKLKDGDRIVFHYTDDYTLENTGFNATESGGADEETDFMVDAVEKMIDNIGSVTFDNASKVKIDAARKAYNKLSLEQKRKVDNYKDLQAAEKTYADLEKKDNQNKADEVSRLIETMGKDSDRITAARNAYDRLTDAQKKLVSNYEELKKAEYERLNAMATEEDRRSTGNVVDLITTIGTKISRASETKILEARGAYDKLSDLQKALTTNYDMLTAAEEAFERLCGLQDFETLYEATGNLLEKLGTPDVGSIGGEWMVIGLARSGRNVGEEYCDRALDFVAENIDENQRLNVSKATDNARLILALTALGEDVHNIGGYDLLAGLNQMAYVEKQGINGPIWTLIALDSNEYTLMEGDATREALVACILDAQLEDGGWTIAGKDADTDMTGMALQALAPYYDELADEDNELNASIEKGIECLSMLQLADGGYGTYDPNGEIIATSESVSQVIVALTALNIDPDTDDRFIKNGRSPLDALLEFGLPEGGFKHLAEEERDQMATEQGYYALTAYARYLMRINRLYDMRDAFETDGADPEPLKLYISIDDSGENSVK